MRPKSKLPLDTIALRQMVWTAAMSFIIGFVASCIGILLVYHAASPQQFWNWGLALRVLQTLPLAVVGGLGLTVICCKALSLWHYRRGYHHCPHCGQVLKGIDRWCSCDEMQALKHEAEALQKGSVA